MLLLRIPLEIVAMYFIRKIICMVLHALGYSEKLFE